MIIITDGRVFSIEECEERVNFRRFNSVRVIYANEKPEEMNLTVSAAFTRNCHHVTIIVNGELLVEAVPNRTLELESYFDNPDKFFSKAADILQLITIKNMGRSNVD